MFRRILLLAVAAAMWLVPAQLMAGGPPRLCIPIDGVTADNAEACAGMIVDALGDHVGEVQVRQNEEQWYAIFTFNVRHLSLSQIEAALDRLMPVRSPFSVPRDKLRLFGPVVLEIDAGTAAPDKLTNDLAAVEHVLVGESEREEGVLLVTAEMPNAKHFGRRTEDFVSTPVSRETFQGTMEIWQPTRSPSNVPAKPAPPVTSRDLPSYGALREVVEKHNAKLIGIRWRCWGCRVLGCVTAPDTDADADKATVAE